MPKPAASVPGTAAPVIGSVRVLARALGYWNSRLAELLFFTTGQRDRGAKDRFEDGLPDGMEDQGQRGVHRRIKMPVLVITHTRVEVEIGQHGGIPLKINSVVLPRLPVVLEHRSGSGIECAEVQPEI